jgi:hypothetical protein
LPPFPDINILLLAALWQQACQTNTRTSKVLLKIHPPMKNADNIHSPAAQAEEDGVRTGEKFLATSLYFGTSPFDSGIGRYGFDIMPKLADKGSAWSTPQ